MADYELIIVGGGPAGLTAGIYAVRKGLKTLVVERASLGGTMQMAREVENWPGDRLVEGPTLSKRMAEHARSLDVDFVYSDVIALELSGDDRGVMLRDGRDLKAKALIIATGGKHKTLKVKGEEEYTGKGVTYCATCDGPFFRDKTVAIVGEGNMAVEDALYMSTIAKKTYLIGRRLSADDGLIARLGDSGIEHVEDMMVGVYGGDMVEGVRLAGGTALEVQGVFISMGHSASTELAKQSGIELEGNFIKVDANQKTNVEGVYAAGDVTGGVFQIVVAASEGAKAALKAYEYVRDNA
jgi:thioredoxin reductase (NADPH)